MPDWDSFIEGGTTATEPAPKGGTDWGQFIEDDPLDPLLQREAADREAIGLPPLSAEQVAHYHHRYDQPTAAPSAPAGGEPAVPGPAASTGDIVNAWSHVPRAAAAEATADTARGLYGAARAIGMPEATRAPDTGVNEALGVPNVSLGDFVNAWSGSAHRQAAEDMAVSPRAQRATDLVAGILPVAAGVPVMAASMGGNKFQDEKALGAGDWEARARAAPIAAVGAALPAIGRAAAPLTDAMGQVASTGMAAATRAAGGDAASAATGRLVAAAGQGQVANTALALGDAAGTVQRDPGEAGRNLIDQVTDPTLAVVGSLAHGAGEMAGRVVHGEPAGTGDPHLDQLWSGLDQVPGDRRIDPRTGAAPDLGPQDQLQPRQPSLEAIAGDQGPVAADDPLRAIDPDHAAEIGAMGRFDKAAGETADQPFVEAVRAIPPQLLDVPVAQGMTLRDAVAQIDPAKDPEGWQGNLDMVRQAAEARWASQKGLPPPAQLERVRSEEQDGPGGAPTGPWEPQGESQAPRDRIAAQRDQEAASAAADEHAWQVGRSTDPELQRVRDEEQGRTAGELAAVEDQRAGEQARQDQVSADANRAAIDADPALRALAGPEPVTIGRGEPKPTPAAAPERMTPARARKAAADRAARLADEETPSTHITTEHIQALTDVMGQIRDHLAGTPAESRTHEQGTEHRIGSLHGDSPEAGDARDRQEQGRGLPREGGPAEGVPGEPRQEGGRIGAQEEGQRPPGGGQRGGGSGGEPARGSDGAGPAPAGTEGRGGREPRRQERREQGPGRGREERQAGGREDVPAGGEADLEREVPVGDELRRRGFVSQGDAAQRRKAPAADKNAKTQVIERSGVAPAERENKRPDLATPGLDPAVRDAHVQTRNEMPDPGVRKQAGVRDAARELVEKHQDQQHQRLRDLIAERRPYTDEEGAVHHALSDRLYRQGRMDEFRELAKGYQLAGTEGARGQAMRVDRVQTPEGRAMEGRELAVLPRPKAAREQDAVAKELAQVKKQLAVLQAREKAGAKGPNPSPARKAVQGARARAKTELKEAWANLNRVFSSRSFNSLGAEQIKALSAVVGKLTKLGILKAADAALAIADNVRAFRHDPEMHDEFERLWNEQRTGGMDEAKGITDLLDADPRYTAEKRLEKAQQRLKALNESTTKLAADLEAMTPEQRRLYLQGEAARKEMPPAWEQMRAETAANIKALRDRIDALSEEANPEVKASLQEQVAAEQDRMRTLHDTWQARVDRLSQLTYDELRAEAASRKPPPEVEAVRRAAMKETADLRRQLDALTHPAELYGPDVSEQRKRLDAKATALQERLDILRTHDAERFDGDKAHMKDLGFDLDAEHPDWASDPEAFARFHSALEATRGGWPAVLREMYVGMLHSGPAVLGKKVVSDTISGGLRFWNRHLETLANSVDGRVDGASLGELGAGWRALFPAIARGMRNGWDTLRTEAYPKELTAADDLQHYPTIRGVKGSIFRQLSLLPAVRSIDAFTRTVVAHTEVAMQAYRTAVDESGKRLAGDELEQHVNRELMDLRSESWGRARDMAMRATFTEPPLPLVREINAMKYAPAKGMWGATKKTAANVLFPFTTIPSNIMKQGLMDHIPVISDALTVAKALRTTDENGVRTYDRNHFNADVAQAVTRWMTFAGMAWLASNGGITGSEDKKNPKSFVFFGHHFSYQHLGPIATGLAAAADYWNAKPGERAKSALLGELKHMGEEGIARPLVDIGKAFTHQDGAVKYAAGLAGSLEPSLLRQTGQALNDYTEKKQSRSARGQAEGGPLDRFLTYVHEGLEIPGQYPKAWTDSDGNPIKKEQFDGAVSTFLWRLFSPARLGEQVPAKR